MPKLTTGQRNAATILRLESQLRSFQELLDLETGKLLRAKARVALLHALALASDALNAMLTSDNTTRQAGRAAAGAGGSGSYSAGVAEACVGDAAMQAAAGAVQAIHALEEHLQVLRQQLWRGGGDGGGGGGDGQQQDGSVLEAGGTADGGSEAAAADAAGRGSMPPASGHGSGPRSGSVGAGAAPSTHMDGDDEAAQLQQQPEQPQQQQQPRFSSSPAVWDFPLVPGSVVSAEDFLRRVLAARTMDVTRDEFIALWRDHASRVGMLLHQHNRGRTTCMQWADLNQLWLTLPTSYAGLLLSERPWVAGLLSLNLETGANGEPPESVWDEVLDIININEEQGLMLLLLRGWWHNRMANAAKRRQELAQLALTAPHDVFLQHDTLTQLERLQSGYVRHGAAANVVLLTAVLTPLQCAEVYVQAYPYLPSLTGVLERWHARATAAGGTTDACTLAADAAGSDVGRPGDGGPCDF